MTETSVIIPVLNGEKHVAAACASVADQLAEGDEIILVDNGSIDGTAEVIAKLDDPRVRILTEATRGPAAARNRGLQEAQGRFVAFLDHDDLWPAGRHRKMLDLFTNDIDAVRGRIRMRFDNGVDPSYVRLDGSLSPHAGVPAFLFRRQAIDRSGGFDTSMVFGEDTDFLARFLSSAPGIAFLDADALIYRRHLSNMTLDTRALARGNLEVVRKNLLRNRDRQL